MTDSNPPGLLSFPAPDVVLFSAKQGSGLEQLTLEMERRAAQGRFYLIIDFSDFSAGIDADLRDRGPRMVQPEWLLGAVYVNASTTIRVALKVMKLAMMLSKHPFPTEYSDSVESALAMIDEMRGAPAS